ncbi:hypothetical protein CONCODRAFT_14605 [Conidiobolus coronatus NRRL 28638]|uniref:Uncharacterized protein n=1 Tax=Conidiobolus coronatus (strain ATCC 28846 / CBS 209.66 / NRRL 28638) TaxID=796925 RepID=A0A137PI04_CONC2|nr:hypothetical protein CONCODRAFT_14605 [Conidiobolus coronatus NRRL 28638]|eukprot:KXN74634.1 hypothetical protein CONCODRAFT_14605 [Conidiobolus coronatus NRRL 28638]
MSKRKLDAANNMEFDLLTELKLTKEKFDKNKTNKFTLGKDKQVKKKVSLFDKKNKGVENRQQMDQFNKDPATLKDREKLELSKKCLEKKAKIYNLLKKKGRELYSGEGEVEDLVDKNGENILREKFLINFEAKGYNTDSDNDDEEDENNSNKGDEEYMEIEDEFGRTRKILKKEFSSYEDMYFLNENNEPQLMSEDMRRERERLRWEKETLREIQMGPEHYNQSGENRQLGVGFYKFSADQEERARQMEELNKLRKETERIRAENGLDENSKKERGDDPEIKLKLMKEKLMEKNSTEAEEVSAFLDSLKTKHLEEDDDDNDEETEDQ